MDFRPEVGAPWLILAFILSLFFISEMDPFVWILEEDHRFKPIFKWDENYTKNML